MKIRAITPATVIASLALLFALSGTAVAGALITGANVKNNSLTGVDIKNESLGTADIKNGSLLPKDFKAGSLPAGAQGPAGPAGRSAGPRRPAGSERLQRSRDRPRDERARLQHREGHHRGLPGGQEGRRWRRLRLQPHVSRRGCAGRQLPGKRDELEGRRAGDRRLRAGLAPPDVCRVCNRVDRSLSG